MALIALQIDPEGANLFLAMVPDAVGAARTVRDEVAALHHVQKPVDLDGELAFEDEAVFEAVVGDRLFGRTRMRRVFVDGDP